MRPRSITGLALLVTLICGSAFAQDFESCPHRMEVPAEIRAYYRNPDGSCVQCSIGMCDI